MGLEYKVERLQPGNTGAWHDSRCRGYFTREEWQWIESFIRDLRPLDVRELNAGGGVVEEIMASIDQSESCWRVTGQGGEPLVLFGKKAVHGVPGRLIWCMGTRHLCRYEREFARVSKQILLQWTQQDGCLYNACGAFNLPAIRWLTWCGARFGCRRNIRDEEFIDFVIGGN